MPPKRDPAAADSATRGDKINKNNKKMAGQFLASHGVDIDSIMAAIQDDGPAASTTLIRAARLPRRPRGSLWDIHITPETGRISSIAAHIPTSSSSSSSPSPSVNAKGRLCAPPLCHAHVHLDKCHLLHTPAYADLRITDGTFEEAMSLTNTAKSRFTESDLLQRGRRLIHESMAAGVTSMRAFVEVDEVVRMACVHAALKLKAEFKGRCLVQVCVFAQLALFTSKHAQTRRKLLEEAVVLDGVDALGSTPYVENELAKMKGCVQYTINLALKHDKNLDFHLDYNIDGKQQPLVWYVLTQLREAKWDERASQGKTICLGHCTRLTLFADDEWEKLREAVGSLPVSFVGLPTSDLFMQGRQKGGARPRATLQVPEVIVEHGLQAAISINNIGNAFTPHGSCDPLAVASLGVGIYQAGTEQDTELLYECVSSRAAAAIGVESAGLDMEPGQPADVVLYAGDYGEELQLSHLVYTPHGGKREVVMVCRQHHR